MSASHDDASRVEVTYRTGEDGQMIPDEVPTDVCTWNCDEKCLDIVTGVVIFINVVVMGVELDVRWDGFSYLEQAMLCVYILDVILRIRWHGIKSYASDKSHVLDVIIVGASVCEVWILPATVSIEDSFQGTKTGRKRGNIVANVTMTLRSFRLVRAFRLLKLLKFAKPLYMILQSMVSSFKRVCWVMALLAVFLYAFSLVFTQLLGRDMMNSLPDEDPTLSKLRDNFSTVPRTFFELFRLMCGDVTDFGLLMSAEDNVVVPLVYMVFQVSTPWLILSIFTAEVVDTTITNSNNLDREEIAMKALHSRTIRRDELSNELHTLLEELKDSRGRDYIELGSLATFLENEDNLSILNDITGLTAFQAINAWEAMENNGKVSKEDYIDGLVLASHQSPEHSVLRMEAQMQRMTKSQLLLLDALGLAERGYSRKEGEDDDGETRSVDTRSADRRYSVMPVRSEEPEVEPDLHREIAQLQRSLQSVQTGLEIFLRDRSLTQDAENNAAVEIRKMHCDLSGMSSDFYNIKDLRTELQQLRDEIAQQPAHVNDMKHLMQRTMGNANASDMHDVRAGILNVEGEITALRAEVVSMVRTFRTDHLASVRRGISTDSDIKPRVDRFAELRSSEASSRELSSRLGRTSPTPTPPGARSLDLESLSPLTRSSSKTFFNTEPTFAERRGLTTKSQALPFQDTRQAPLLQPLRESIRDRINAIAR